MKLSVFEDELDEELLAKGEHYFKSGRVTKLYKSDPGSWTAEVRGTQKYTVRAEIENNIIRSWHCTCPYDFGPICKHVVAVFLGIRAGKNDPKPGEKKQKEMNESDMIRTILEKATKKDITEFINRHLVKYDKLAGDLIAHFSDRIEGDLTEKYETIVKNLIENARIDDDYINYYEMRNLGDSLYQFVTKAEQLEKQKQYDEAWSICRALIRNVPGINEYGDDSNGETTMIMESAFNLLHKLYKKAGQPFSDRCFVFCVDEYHDKKYSDLGYDDYFLFLIPELVHTPDQEKEYFKLLDTAMKHEESKEYSSYSRVRLLGSKIDYLLKAKREDEALAIIRENLRYSDIRKRLVDRAVRRKEYAEAKTLSEAGLTQARQDKHPGTAILWMEKLLEIAGLEKDRPAIRNWTKTLFFEKHGDMVYYKKLKISYPLTEWLSERDSIILKLGDDIKKSDYCQSEALASIFVEECMFDKLLSLLQLNHTQVHFVDRYASCLKDDFPGETLALYEQLIMRIVPNTGREIYQQIAGFMKKMKKIKSGNERVQKLKQEFQIKYKNRKAMMSIISGV